MGLETERKYVDIDIEALRSRLAALGAASGGRHLESNVIYDNAAGALKAKRYLLRLRTQQWLDKSTCILTLKTPPANMTNEKLFHIKIREELEVEVSDFKNMDAILKLLGFLPVARYEKMRETWTFPALPEKAWIVAENTGAVNVKVDLDILPFCNVAEIEGDLALINAVADRLALDKTKISTKSYHELHQAWLESNCLPPSLNFEFPEKDKKALKGLISQYA